MSILTETWGVVLAIFSADPYEMKPAFNASGMWLFTFFSTAFIGYLVYRTYKALPWLEKNLERMVIIYTYLVVSGIIFWGVIDRFVFSHQFPWSTTIPPLLFMIMAWYGCSYNVKLRTHLSFNELRINLPKPLQMMTLCIDAALWFGFCWVVTTTTLKSAVNSAANFQIVLGTDNVMQWWFIVTIPMAFSLMAGRVVGNLAEDIHNYKSGNPLVKQAIIGKDA